MLLLQLLLPRRSQGPSGEDSPGHGGSGDGGGAASDEEGPPLALPAPGEDLPPQQQQLQQEVRRKLGPQRTCCTRLYTPAPHVCTRQHYV